MRAASRTGWLRRALPLSVAVGAVAIFLAGVGGGDNSARGQRAPKPIVVGSKTFTESRILAEIMAQLIEANTDLPVRRRLGLGGTLICFSALRQGELDLYPDYTGTGWAAVLKEPEPIRDPLRAYLHVRAQYELRYDLTWLTPFGFENSYALAMDETKAAALGLSRISDLAPHASSLRAGVSHEFLRRADGYPGLARAYGLKIGQVRGMEHGLAYQAIRSGKVDLIDAYSTDGKLLKFKLRVLEDDRRFFPPYHAAPVVRRATLRRHPQLRPLLERLGYRLSAAAMQRLNHQVEAQGRSFAAVARAFLLREGLLEASAARPRGEQRGQGFWRLMASRWHVTLELTLRHLQLSGAAVLLAILLAVPLGIAASRLPLLRRLSLGAAGVIQTVPSLALLAFMIPLPGLGLGARSAIAALVLYAVLPILRNTYTGIVEVDPDLLEAAEGMGLRQRQILTRVQLPLAVRTIMAGVRTAAVISVGVATLAAFIGAGGLGEPILTGLELNDTDLILTGAAPAALLAVLVDLALGLVERVLTPRGA